MHYIFEEGKAQGKKLLLLHGTGGDENSLLEIAQLLDPNATILSIRGRIQEDGMNRYFKRNGLNQFDFESLEEETDHLLTEIISISKEKQIAVEDWVIVGYSNGANIAAHAMLERESQLQKGILFHPMSLGVDTKQHALSHHKVWLSFGINDPIVSKDAADQLISQLENRGANVSVERTVSGHQITIDEVNSAKKWLMDV
ncbi:alpha/beta hydrolase [Enterococcus quebecensis]|uniref:Phospholipase n=1 Tax=Enterococcus quebecensis TaxID=903983 RepID=A0A1E5H329_9ENTE|nr:alpha/beta hydrolase [Enterococcus quebecensis]OEG19292.1 phospholipase [Enterococcus quebecensis]